MGYEIYLEYLLWKFPTPKCHMIYKNNDIWFKQTNQYETVTKTYYYWDLASKWIWIIL